MWGKKESNNSPYVTDIVSGVKIYYPNANSKFQGSFNTTPLLTLLNSLADNLLGECVRKNHVWLSLSYCSLTVNGEV